MLHNSPARPVLRLTFMVPTCTALVMCYVLTLFPTPATATTHHSDNAVAVILAGGIQEAETFDLYLHNDAYESEYFGQRRFFRANPTEILSVSDIKILPYGMHLLADANGRDVLVTSSNAEALLAMRTPSSSSHIASASVVSYRTNGEPRQVLITDNAQARAMIYDFVDERYLWARDFLLPNARATLTQAIFMPEQTVAVAANWPMLHTYAIDIVTLGAPDNAQQLSTNVIRLSNQLSAENPGSVTLVPELTSSIREIMAFSERDILVTTQHALIKLAIDGHVHWVMDIAEYPEINGEFVSARYLSSGLIAVATMQPGLWTQSHTNHRIHWIDPQSRKWLASSSALERAPRRVESIHGHGGTGTLGYQAEFGFNPSGLPSQLLVDSPLSFDQSTYQPGESFSAHARLSNSHDEAMWFRTVELRAIDRPCDDSPINLNTSFKILYSTTDVFIEPQGSFELHANSRVDAAFSPPGNWCAYIAVEARDHSWHLLETTEDFSIVPRHSSDNSSAHVRDLGSYNDVGFAPDSDNDDTDSDAPSIELREPNASCACNHQHSGSLPSSFVLAALLVTGIIIAHRRPCNDA